MSNEYVRLLSQPENVWMLYILGLWTTAFIGVSTWMLAAWFCNRVKGE